MNVLEKSIVHVYQLSMRDQARNSWTELKETTGAYVSKLPSCRSPQMQYCALNFLKVLSGTCFTRNTQVPGNIYVVAVSIGTSSQHFNSSNLNISLMAALIHSSHCSPCITFSYVNISGLSGILDARRIVESGSVYRVNISAVSIMSKWRAREILVDCLEDFEL